jgi:hypothetical protein
LRLGKPPDNDVAPHTGCRRPVGSSEAPGCRQRDPAGCSNVSLLARPRAHSPGHQLTMTEAAWASMMRRTAAGHLGAVSENQNHKVRCRSAVGRVGRQSTLKRHPLPSTRRPEAVAQICSLAIEGSPAAAWHTPLGGIHGDGGAARGLRPRCLIASGAWSARH